MRTSIVPAEIVIISFFILISISSICSSTSNANPPLPLDFEVKLLSSEAYQDGPIPLSLQLTNRGKESLYIAPINAPWLDLSVDAPQSWKYRKSHPSRDFDGMLPVVELAGGMSVSQVIYLHDLFTEIEAGKVELTLTLRVWPDGGQATTPLVLSGDVSLHITESNAEKFAQRIRDIVNSVEQTSSADQRMEIYRSVASLSHPDLIFLFIQSLRDRAVLTFHDTARRRLVELCAREEEWAPIIEYLVHEGTKQDSFFFYYWKRELIRLEAHKLQDLNNCSNLWIRFYAATLPGQRNPEGILDSLHNEVAAFAAEVARARKMADGKD